MRIEAPFPSAKLSGHNTGHWSKKSGEITMFKLVGRQEASSYALDIPPDGDIFLRFDFYPPDNRGDRTNYYNRCKALIDGIADGLGVNDKRFVPIMDASSFHPPEKPGRVVVTLALA